MSRARLTTSARGGYVGPSAGLLARYGSPPPTSTSRLPAPEATTRVVKTWSGPKAARAAVVVSSLVVDAGITDPRPSVTTAEPGASPPTTATTCLPRSGSASPGAIARRTRAGAGRTAASSGTATGAGSTRSGRINPSGGGTAAGSVSGSGPARRSST